MKLSNDPEYLAWKLQVSTPRVDSPLITYKGLTKSRSQWAAITGISNDMIRKRLKRGWTVEQALTIGATQLDSSSN